MFMSITNNEEKVTIKEVEVTSARVIRHEEDTEDYRIGFTMVVAGVTIYNCIAFTYKDKKTGKKAWGISFPSRKGNDGKWYNEVYFFITPELKDNIIQQIDKILG